MRHRHAISDADWARIEGLLPGRPGQHGKVTKDNRLFIDAVLWIAKTGASGATCPSAWATGTRPGAASIGGRARGCGSACSRRCRTATWNG